MKILNPYFPPELRRDCKPPQLNLNRPPIMFLRKSGSEPPVGVVRLTKSNTLPSFMP